MDSEINLCSECKSKNITSYKRYYTAKYKISIDENSLNVYNTPHVGTFIECEWDMIFEDVRMEEYKLCPDCEMYLYHRSIVDDKSRLKINIIINIVLCLFFVVDSWFGVSKLLFEKNTLFEIDVPIYFILASVIYSSVNLYDLMRKLRKGNIPVRDIFNLDDKLKIINIKQLPQGRVVISPAVDVTQLRYKDSYRYQHNGLNKSDFNNKHLPLRASVLHKIRSEILDEFKMKTFSEINSILSHYELNITKRHLT